MSKDYKKLYEEALERARIFKSPFCQHAAEVIFPELRESEDERIRKSLIKGFQHYDKECKWGEFTTTEILSWLEKQDEQKHTPKYKIGDCIKYRGEEYKITNITVTANNFYYNVSLIKEPSDWGEVVAAIGMAAEEQMFKIEQTLTWSEEDEKFLNYAISLTDDAQIKNFLKSLKDRVQPQPKQGWSEEDEYQLNTILHGLDLKRELYKKEGNQVEEKRYKTQYDWLKSLKPQNRWKPSEEQMEALNAINNIGELSYVEQADLLIKLYNDLEKL